MSKKKFLKLGTFRYFVLILCVQKINILLIFIINYYFISLQSYKKFNTYIIRLNNKKSVVLIQTSKT